MSEFSMTKAQTIYNSNKQFPINFDDAWQWLGYSTKGNAKRALVQNFERDSDFIINDEATTTGISAIPTELICISIDCFKSLAMMAKTDVGKVARKYFIECERLAKEAQLAPSSSTQALLNDLHSTAKDKCFNDSHADYAIHGSLQYQKKLDPQLKATVQIGMIMANLRLECESAHSMIGEKCENIVNKQFRHTQMKIEGIESIPDNCLPKAELTDKQKALANNPSSKQHLLPVVNSLTTEQLTEATRIDLKTLKDPTRYANIEQFALPQGTPIDDIAIVF